MAKLKAPLLSFGASASLAKRVSFAQRNSTHYVRSKPTPRDPYTLAQAYHRWDYQDYAYLWHALTDSEKQGWETNARRLKITGFNYWMRTRLNTLPDLTGRWRLDELGGSVAHDSSKNLNHGTYFGTTPATGLIGGCRHFDSVDDCIKADGIFYSGTTYTLRAWVNPTAWTAQWGLSICGQQSYPRWMLQKSNQKVRFYGFANGAPYGFTSTSAITLGIWTRLAIVIRPDGHCLFYFNGNLDRDQDINKVITFSNPTTYPFFIGTYNAALPNDYYGLLDDIIVSSRELTQPELLIDAERRYPPL